MATEVRGRSFVERVPWGVVAVTVTLCVLALFNLASAAATAHTAVHFAQARWYALGFAAAAMLAAMDYRHVERFAWVIYAATLALLAAVPVIGDVRMGAQRWLALGPLSLQPSELMKPAVVLALARYFEHRQDKGPYTNRQLLVAYGLVGLPFLVILEQPDLGTATMVGLVGFSVIAFAGIRLLSLVALGVGGVGAAVGGWYFVLHDYQKRRVLTFLEPGKDELGAAYHANQSLIAVGSGGIDGKGWRGGTQTHLSFLPEHHTDFAFSVWSEEHGFVGATLTLLLFFALIVLILNVAGQARDRFGSLVCVGVAALIFWQMFINVAMVIGLAPVVGVTLPFFSYGGSSVLTVFLGLGLVASVHARRFVF